MLNNRQGNNNRRRGRNNNNQRPQGNSNGRNDNGSRIDNRARGNAPQMLEKYKTLARDAQMQGDRVLTEYYHQFADHYFRVVSETRSRAEESRPRRDDYEGGEGEDGQNDNRAAYDDAGEDDMNERTFDDSRRAPPQRQYRDDRSEADAQREEGEQREAREDRAPRGSQQREDRAPREQQARPARYERTPRAERQSNDRQSSERQPRNEADTRVDTRVDTGEERPAKADRQALEHQPAVRQPFERQPRRPRFEQADDAAQTDAPLTLDLGVLPPAIALTPDPVSSEATEAAPKRRGRPKKVTDTEIA